MFNRFKVGNRLFFLVAMMTIGTVVVAMLGLNSMSKIQNEMRQTREASINPLIYLGKMGTRIVSSAADIYRSLQHDPQSEIVQIHYDHAMSEHLDIVERNLAEIDRYWKEYINTPLSERERQLVSEFEKHYVPFVRDVLRPTISALQAENFSFEVQKNFGRGYRQYGQPLEKVVDELIDYQEEIAKTNYADAEQAYGDSRSFMLLTFVVLLSASTFLAWIIIRSIIRPLTDLQTAMAEIERNGDFTRRAPVAGTDEVGQTAASFNQLLKSLQEAFSEILTHTERLGEAAAELATTSQQAAKGSEMTSESSSAMAASVEEMTVSITHVSDNARETAEITQRTGQSSKEGSEIIHQAVDEMRMMAEAVNSSSEIINELSQQSERISGIVQVIRDVADQTNLLALNAAIEAARAGEQGRGFAVVADEVRKLAERTSNATSEISTMINAIQSSSLSAVGVMSQAAERVESGVALADRAGKAIIDIQSGAEQVQSHVNDITSSLSEQTVASQTIAQQVERVAQAAEENSAAAFSSSDSASSLERLAQAMRGATAKFSV